MVVCCVDDAQMRVSSWNEICNWDLNWERDVAVLLNVNRTVDEHGTVNVHMVRDCNWNCSLDV